jgi:hypothetical protein
MKAYEEERHFVADASPVEVLRTLMDANNLRQKDLAPILGSESIVSEVLPQETRTEQNPHREIEQTIPRFAGSVFLMAENPAGGFVAFSNFAKLLAIRLRAKAMRSVAVGTAVTRCPPTDPYVR